MGCCNSTPVEHGSDPNLQKVVQSTDNTQGSVPVNQSAKASCDPKPETKPESVEEVVTEEDSNVGRKRMDDVWSRFKVLKTMGIGGYGKVMAVRDLETQKEYAMKSVARYRNGKDYSYRFWNECDVLQSLKDVPSVVSFHDAFFDDEHFYLLCELLTGGELLDHILKSKKFSEKQASIIFHQMLKPLQSLHKLNIAHLDLKPENFVFSTPESDPNRYIVMIDFGTVQKIADDEISDVRTGTPYYIAPQMLQSKIAKTGKILRGCDMWSMGVILFVLTTGRLPFYGDERKEILKSVLSGKYEYPEDSNLSDELKDLISRLLTMDVDARINVEETLAHPWLTEVDSVSDEPFHPTVLAGIAHCWNDFSLKKAIGSLLVHDLSEQDKSQLQSMFEEWDTNGDGMLQYVEIVRMVEKLGYDKGEANIVAKALVDEFDMDKNGVIDLNEFAAISTRGILSLNKDFVNQLFDYVDRDGNGIISKNEIELYFSEQPDFTLEMDVMSIIQEVDLDHDGCISREEFMHAMSSRGST